ncbi:uncharacterized protein P174DRAFT_421352 [Aspergillus novofumigatus IBT 16806]|uniref:Uncharacterized protein n=1 Tax=Aspergillus novofumigatus (strain IBT 16806) TaxID=1392255 RepID=A0A2I1C3R9_ASPN1|nr:uncharacterized protein P174DRAFT_421352 [Aspergillus novofumigatus IBT 16806]PKX92279.1 hypothetical protein P174DRAFT_421352 [Aspergillus novofumigatus IBT 16806]
MSIPAPTVVDTEAPIRPNRANCNNNDSNDDLQDTVMESWEPRDYLYYPVRPEMSVPGVDENSIATSFNLQSLLGFIVPGFGPESVDRISAM